MCCSTPAAIRWGPEADYELSEHGGGCEDPRISYVEPLQRYVMTYTALSRRGPRIEIAISDDLFHWRRLGLATFRPYHGIAFDGVDDKDASIFPMLIPDPAGQLALALVHRPLFPGTRPEEKVCRSASYSVDIHRESIWISYNRVTANGEDHRLGEFSAHHRLASPEAAWERLKIGGGAPPIICRHGWLMIYHGVHDIPEPTLIGRKMCYSAGAMVLSKEHPNRIIYRSPDPVLVPEGLLELHGTIDNVVFPPASIAATILERPIASTSITAWRTTASERRVWMFQRRFRRIVAWGIPDSRRRGTSPVQGEYSSRRSPVDARYLHLSQ